MLSSDRSEPRADQRRRRRARAHHHNRWEQEQSFDPSEPWDGHSAEALTCLYESEEGRLSRPAAGDRARRPHAQTADAADDATGPAAAVDRPWLEAHLTRLVERLQASLAEANPEESLVALNGRLETIEQRFGATLGRVAQRADLDGLRSIEVHVLKLATQLEQARERLEQIGAVDEQVRALTRKLDEAGEQRASGLERLLRDCIAEWREGEQRTAGALQSIEEAVGRLGDAVDAMEASKPAPDLTMPTLTGAELDRAGDASSSPFHGDGERPPAPPLYHPMLDAADYAPKSFAGDSLATAESRPSTTGQEQRPMPSGIADWPPVAGIELGKPAGAKLTAGALRIMALRAKLRQSPTSGRRAAASSYLPAAATEGPPASAIRRASLSLLLMAGAAFVAGSSYFLYLTFVAAAPVSPVMIVPGAHPAAIQSDLSAPLGRRLRGQGAG